MHARFGKLMLSSCGTDYSFKYRFLLARLHSDNTHICVFGYASPFVFLCAAHVSCACAGGRTHLVIIYVPGSQQLQYTENKTSFFLPLVTFFRVISSARGELALSRSNFPTKSNLCGNTPKAPTELEPTFECEFDSEASTEKHQCSSHFPHN